VIEWIENCSSGSREEVELSSLSPCKEELCGCAMGDEVNPCVATQGETLQEVEGSKRCM